MSPATEGGPGAAVAARVLALGGVTARPHRFGGTEFRLEPFELGHVHGDRQADVLVGTAQRAALVAEGSAEPHHLYPDSGWVTIPLGGAADPGRAVERAVAAFRSAHERRSATRRSRPRRGP